MASKNDIIAKAVETAIQENESIDLLLISQSLDEINGAPLIGVQVLTFYKEAWNNGFVIAAPGLTNYRGFIEKTPIVEAENVIYG